MKCVWQWLLAWMELNYCQAYWEITDERERYFQLMMEWWDERSN